MVGASEDGVVTVAQLKFVLDKGPDGFWDWGRHRKRSKQQEWTISGYLQLQKVPKWSTTTTAIYDLMSVFLVGCSTSFRSPKQWKSTVSRSFTVRN